MRQIEKQFFDTFGIEAKCVKRTLKLAMSGYDESDLPEDLRQFISSQAQVYHVYPQITDSILLNLICIANQYEYYPTSTNIKNIQARTLRILLKAKKYLKDTYLHQGWHNELVRKVRKLFKGDNNV